MFRNSVLVIPSLNPDENLIAYVKELISHHFSKIILIDDGSDQKGQEIFDVLRSMPECDLLVHTVNMGKGRALKDAFNYYLQKYSQDYSGVITVDADGQHTLLDVIRLDTALPQSQDELILGVRDFDAPCVPWKSKLGNKMTKYVLRLFIGGARKQGSKQHTKAISDTQTGMRAIPNKLLFNYLTLEGERFEYETNMLIEALHTHTPIQEICIQTVYIDDNRETHFRPLADSAAIYRQIFTTFFKYMLASLSSFLIDYSLYSLLILALGLLPLSLRIWTATAAARILSSLYNYFINMSVVFKNHTDCRKTLEKYYALCILQLCASAQLVWMICISTHASEMAVKLLVDSLLFVASYYFQKNWVFKKESVYYHTMY